MAVAVVLHEGLVLVGRRQRAPLAGFAEFPGGKVLEGESAEAAAAREVREECGITVDVERLLARVPADYPHGRLDLRFYLCRPAATTPPGGSAPTPRAPFRWVTLDELERLDFPSANAAALRAIGLRGCG